MEKIIERAGFYLKKNIFVSKADIGHFMMCLLGFFLGRVVLMQFLSPAAIPFLSAYLFSGSKYFLVAIFTLTGMFTKLDGAFFTKYFICVLIMSVVHVSMQNQSKKTKMYAQMFAGGLSVLASGIGFSIYYGFSLYFALMAVLESVLTISMTYIIRKGIRVLDGTVKRKVLNNEELISLSILMGCMVSGASDVYIGSVSLKFCLSILILLSISYRCGGVYAATAGILLGFMSLITESISPMYLVLLSISAMISGLLRKYGKSGVLIGFILCSYIFGNYLDKSLLTQEWLVSLIFAVTIFIFLPESFYFSFDNLVGVNTDSTEEYLEKVQDVTSAKLKSISYSFDKLGKALSSVSRKRISLNKDDMSKLIDDIANAVCKDCEMQEECWHNHFYRTYQATVSMLSACENKSVLNSDEIPAEFKEACINLNGYAEMLARIFEIYKTNLLWSNKMWESRELVSQQLIGVGKIIDGLSEEMTFDLNFKTGLEENILIELKKNKIEVDNVMVLENKDGRYEVTVDMKSCNRKNFCVREIIPIISGVLGRKMKKEDSFCNIDNSTKKCRISIVEQQRLRVTSAVANAAKLGESGDSYSFMELKNGQCLLVLSDGMGSGKKARAESSAVIELLEDFIESGFEKEMAVKMINSVLVLKSSEESFSTLDICAMDLYSGITEFIKIGASTTFIIRNGEIHTVKSSSLPMGILNNVDLEVSVKKLKNNDIVLMLTDGILDAFTSQEYTERNLTDFLGTIRSVNPQEIADSILEEAKHQSTKESADINDDMTVLAARVFERV